MNEEKDQATFVMIINVVYFVKALSLYIYPQLHGPLNNSPRSSISSDKKIKQKKDDAPFVTNIVEKVLIREIHHD